jgi:toxin ParE1/3/4
MAQLFIKPLAESDLLEIWQYIADDNPKKADQLLDEIEAGINKLLQSPLIGRDRSELVPTLRSILVKRYVVFYRQLEKKNIEIVRILHGARDIPTLLEEV